MLTSFFCENSHNRLAAIFNEITEVKQVHGFISAFLEITSVLLFLFSKNRIAFEDFRVFLVDCLEVVLLYGFIVFDLV